LGSSSHLVDEEIAPFYKRCRGRILARVPPPDKDLVHGLAFLLGNIQRDIGGRFVVGFVGGKINTPYNCVDRHLAKYKNKAELIFVPEPEDEAPISVTYRELYVHS